MILLDSGDSTITRTENLVFESYDYPDADADADWFVNRLATADSAYFMMLYTYGSKKHTESTGLGE